MIEVFANVIASFFPEKKVNEVGPFFNKSSGSPETPDWLYLWLNCEIDPSRKQELVNLCWKIQKSEHRYHELERLTGVPWYLLAAIHYRESSLRFDTCLHNGERLPGPTKLVPKGRGPFLSWEEAATDAIRLMGYDHLKIETPVACLVLAERWNGLGYRKRGEYSHYVWAGTNWSDETGKYVKDGKFDINAPEKQLGVAAIIKELLK